ncbi:MULTISPECIES: glycosyltransferase [Olivibacter]|jgi:glycosyltransferase involved in cell wall biosynthesis|uniref:Glycosyltransferase n=1 Tax=Olivibacter oleidegradans TaxID=760123 RepID=A0ABV6HHG9_9SPHI|nr:MULTISPECIES: glycosyltransferase [Olivibacter]MDM8176670.1 glycosyltransferase [Olivibacter sp. 47]QEL00497.1 glycosyltransferase family 4 protein [Olivibacter sp. LS-1]
MVKLFFDIMITGHHVEYIDHMVNYLREKEDGHNYVFVVHPQFEERFPEIAIKIKEARNLRLVCVSLHEFEKTQGRGLVKMSFNTYRLAHRYALQVGADHVCFLYFNLLQLPLIFYTPSYSVSGILFLQFYRMHRGSLKERIKYLRKYLITKGYTGNKKVNRVFVLNDEQTVSFLNRKFKTSIFKTLADPIPNIEPLEAFSVYEHYGISKDRQIYLHIGSLSDRKGTIEFVNSATYLKPEVQMKVVFLLVGKAGNSQEEEELQLALNELRMKTQVPIIWDNRFVPNAMMKSLFNQCYAVVIPYKNAEASSGILGHAAASNKMVITTGKGLLKDIVNTYQLGLLVDEVTPGEIGRQITVASGHYNFVSKARDFVELKSVDHFAAEVETAL